MWKKGTIDSFNKWDLTIFSKYGTFCEFLSALIIFGSRFSYQTKLLSFWKICNNLLLIQEALAPFPIEKKEKNKWIQEKKASKMFNMQNHVPRFHLCKAKIICFDMGLILTLKYIGQQQLLLLFSNTDCVLFGVCLPHIWILNIKSLKTLDFIRNRKNECLNFVSLILE